MTPERRLNAFGILAPMTPVATGSGSYDAIGFLVAFVLCICMTIVYHVLYIRELRGRHRPDRLRRYRSGVGVAAFVALLVGLRRFVLHV